MSLLPLTVFDCLRRAYRGALLDSYSPDSSLLAERLIASASISDVIKWRGVSRAFRAAATRRIRSYTRLHIRVYEGLAELRAKASNPVDWPSERNVLVCEIDPVSVGICIDARLNWRDAKAMIGLIAIFRHSAQQVFMDSPVVDLLLKHLNSTKVRSLLAQLSARRSSVFSSPISFFLPVDESHAELAVPDRPPLLSGPFFPCLRQFTVTANKSQLSHLSRIIAYCVNVENVIPKDAVDLVCLQVVLGGSWCRSKQRLFRHVSSFKHWLDASSLGVRYVQQFQGEASSRRKRL